MSRDYGAGDCQALATAIQDITSWPVAFVEGAGNHVVIQLPDGRYLDWYGIRTAQDLCTEWEADEVEHIGHISELGWLGCNADAEDYEAAGQVLAAAGLLTEQLREQVAYQIDGWHRRHSG